MIVQQQMQKQQPLPAVSVVQPSSYVPAQQQPQQVYAPMSTGSHQNQQYVTKTSGSTAPGYQSQYQPQVQYAQQAPQTQYKPKPANHMDEITRMLNG